MNTVVEVLPQHPLNQLAWFACIVCVATIGIRAEMLRRRLDPRPDKVERTWLGNWPIIVCMDIAALGFAGAAFELRRMKDDIELAFVALIISCAIASVVMLASMIGHNWRQRVQAARDQAKKAVVDEVANAVETAFPGGIETLRALDRLPDPWGAKRPNPDTEH